MKILLASLSLVLFSSAALAQQNASEQCSLRVSGAKAMIQSDGSVGDSEYFLIAASSALEACSEVAKQRDEMAQRTDKVFLPSTLGMKKKCDQAASQGMPTLYKGNCYLKIADLVSTITE